MIYGFYFILSGFPDYNEIFESNWLTLVFLIVMVRYRLVSDLNSGMFCQLLVILMVVYSYLKETSISSIVSFVVLLTLCLSL